MINQIAFLFRFDVDFVANNLLASCKSDTLLVLHIDGVAILARNSSMHPSDSMSKSQAIAR